jgi:hypothetical protein
MNHLQVFWRLVPRITPRPVWERISLTETLLCVEVNHAGREGSGGWQPSRFRGFQRVQMDVFNPSGRDANGQSAHAGKRRWLLQAV